MKITNRSFEFNILWCSLVNEYYHVKYSIKLVNEITETDFTIVFKTKYNERDLRYISDNIHDLLNNKIKSFGFKSCDKSLSFYVELSSEGMSLQVEIWKEHPFYNYELNLQFDISSLEQIGNMFDSINDRVDHFKSSANSDKDDSLYIKIFNKDDVGNYSICLSLSEDKIIRKNCLDQKDVVFFKSQIVKLLNGEVLSVNIHSDNLFLSICAFGSEYMVDGEIGDFTFPNNNKIRILKGIPFDKNAIKEIFM